MEISQIHELNESEVAEAARLLARVYWTDPSVKDFVAGMDLRKARKFAFTYFSTLVNLGLRRGRVVTAKSAGKIVGVRIFYPPETYPVPYFYSWKALLKLAIIAALTIGPVKFKRLLTLTSVIGDLHPKTPHFYSEITCVDPEYQRRGIATAFTKYLFSLADTIGVGIYIETSNPVNLPIWRRQGYEVVSETTVENVIYWSLYRKPKKKT